MGRSVGGHMTYLTACKGIPWLHQKKLGDMTNSNECEDLKALVIWLVDVNIEW